MPREDTSLKSVKYTLIVLGFLIFFTLVVMLCLTPWALKRIKRLAKPDQSAPTKKVDAEVLCEIMKQKKSIGVDSSQLVLVQSREVQTVRPEAEGVHELALANE